MLDAFAQVTHRVPMLSIRTETDTEASGAEKFEQQLRSYLATEQRKVERGERPPRELREPRAEQAVAAAQDELPNEELLQDDAVEGADAAEGDRPRRRSRGQRRRSNRRDRQREAGVEGPDDTTAARRSSAYLKP